MPVDPTKLLRGPYRSPRTRIGRKLFDEVRGWVVVRRMSAGRIPWPMGGRSRKPAFILCGDLVRAVRTEAAVAIKHWWGVGNFTVTKWRKLLEAPPTTAGTSVLKSACRLGKRRPRHVIEAMRQGNIGRVVTEETRAKMRASRKASGLPPPNGRPWTAKEDRFLRALTIDEV